MNPFQPLYDACNTGHAVGKYSRLPEFPRLIDLEPTNACNFRCLMCPVGNHAMTRPTGVMKRETFRRIADACIPHKTALRFIGWGEPFLNPHLLEFIGIASANGLLTHINTNGSMINYRMAEALVSSGLSSIKFSFQGVDRESYAEMRNIDFYDGLRDATAMVHRLRGNRMLPYIQVSTTTTYETEEQVRAFREAFEPICDHVSVGKTVFAHMDLKATRLRPEERETLERLAVFEPANLVHPSPCPEVYDKLTIQWDGSVRVCCNDFDGLTNLGNVMDRPLSDIWRDKTIEDYRKRLADGEYEGPLCGSCYHYMEGTA